MKNTDLRIGNWVFRPDINQNVRVSVTTFNSNIHDLKPIPLTEEVLLKCGFERGCFYHTKPIDFKVKINEYYYILIYFLDGDLNCYVTDMGDYECESEIFVYIKYLHELQNLISSFKGQELKIEL